MSERLVRDVKEIQDILTNMVLQCSCGQTESVSGSLALISTA